MSYEYTIEDVENVRRWTKEVFRLGISHSEQLMLESILQSYLIAKVHPLKMEEKYNVVMRKRREIEP